MRSCRETRVMAPAECALGTNNISAYPGYLSIAVKRAFRQYSCWCGTEHGHWCAPAVAADGGGAAGAHESGHRHVRHRQGLRWRARGDRCGPPCSGQLSSHTQPNMLWVTSNPSSCLRSHLARVHRAAGADAHECKVIRSFGANPAQCCPPLCAARSLAADQGDSGPLRRSHLEAAYQALDRAGRVPHRNVSRRLLR